MSYITMVLFQGGEYLTSPNQILTCLCTGSQTSRSGVHKHLLNSVVGLGYTSSFSVHVAELGDTPVSFSPDPRTGLRFCCLFSSQHWWVGKPTSVTPKVSSGPRSSCSAALASHYSWLLWSNKKYMPRLIFYLSNSCCNNCLEWLEALHGSCWT